MTQLLNLSTEDAEEYSRSLAQIGEGWWRQVAWAFRQGIPEALDMSRREWAETYHGYFKLPVTERREAVAELAAEGMNNTQIADTLGVAEATIRNDLRADSQNYESGPEATAEPQVDELFNDTDSQNYESVEPGEAPSTRDLLAQSDENEWYTPRRFIEAAAAVLGSIDLDPASSAMANEIVGATSFYTIDDNGLALPWKGTVWLNPPYGGQNRLFVERLIREYEAGNVSAACLLVNCHPAETAWFQRLFEYTVCFVRGRIDFTGPARDRASTSTHGSAIAYLGPDWSAFAETFARFGSVVRRV